MMFPRLRASPGGGQREEPSCDHQVLKYFNEIFPPSDPLRVENYDQRYSKVQILGTGRFGSIIKLLDHENNKFVAGKIINLELFNHWTQTYPKVQKRIDAFLCEYRRIQKLSLANDRIADFLGIAADASRIVVLYEFAPNGNVKDRLEIEPLSEAIALKYFYQTADALQFLHGQRIVHTDIKAANLLLSTTDNVKLANFGLVRDLTIGGFGMAVASEITEDFRATLLYVAPEVLKCEYGPGDRRAYMPPADVWSLGCTLVEMLTCYPPYFEYYDNCDNFYTDVLARARGPIEKQLPYDCFSLVPTSSTIIRFLVNKAFDKSPATRISAGGFANFFKSLTPEILHQKTQLENEFQKAYESSQKTLASTKRGIFQSFKGYSIQSLSKLRGTETKKDDEAMSNVSEENIEEGQQMPSSNRPRRKRKRRKKKQAKECWFCIKYSMSRTLYFLYMFLKSFMSVATFVLLGLTALSMFFLIAFGVVSLVRSIVSYFCDCDLMTPPVLIISGIFLILLFGLLFSCCMVALGEYKFRIANKSLHTSRFFVRRPDKDIRMFGIRLVRGKRLVLNKYRPEWEEETMPEIPLRNPDEGIYNEGPTPIPPEDDAPQNDGRHPTIIVEEPTRKLATTSVTPLVKGFNDLYLNEPPPSPISEV